MINKDKILENIVKVLAAIVVGYILFVFLSPILFVIFQFLLMFGMFFGILLVPIIFLLVILGIFGAIQSLLKKGKKND